MYKAFLGWTRIFLSPALGEVYRIEPSLILFQAVLESSLKEWDSSHGKTGGGLFTIFVTILPHLLIDQDLNLNALLPMVS